MAMMAMTTKSSINVNAGFLFITKSVQTALEHLLPPIREGEQRPRSVVTGFIDSHNIGNPLARRFAL
jgi:hypothetical protein